MTKKLYFHLILAAVLLGIALVYDFSFSTKTRVDSYAEIINNRLHQQEKDVELFFDDKEFINRQLSNKKADDISVQEQDFEKLKQLSEKAYSITIHQKDSLVFWTNNIVLPDTKNKSGERVSNFIKLKNGYYESITQSFQDPIHGEYTITGLIPIQYQFKIESKYLKDKFNIQEQIPSNIVIAEDGSYPIKNYKGQVLCQLKSKGELFDQRALRTSLLLYLIALIAIALFFHKVAQRFLEKKLTWQGAAFFIIAMFGLRMFTHAIGFGDHFQELSLFTKNFDTILSSSLGDLLINIVLLFWVMAFFHNEFPVQPFQQLKKSVKFRITTLNYLAIFGSILLLTAVFKTLVFDTQLNFDFDNIFDLTTNTSLAITGLILLLISLFLFSHRMMLTIKRINLDSNLRLFAIGIAALVCLPILVYVDFTISPLYLMLIAFVFVLVFDFFIDSNTINFTWLLIWLVILAGIPSILLFRYNGFKDRLVRKVYAQELVDTKDLIVEESLGKLRTHILEDASLRQTLKYDSIKLEESAVRKKIDPLFVEDNYLFYNYNYKIYGFDNSNESIITNQKTLWDDLDLKLEASDFASTKDLKYWSNDLGKSAYLMKLDFEESNDSIGKTSLIIEFQRQRREQSKVYTELLDDKAYKNLAQLDRYDYAVYKNNQQIDYEGKVYGNVLKVNDLPEEGSYKEEIIGNRSELIYNAPNDIVVIIGKETEDQLKKAISLFSYIFCILLLFVVFFTVINYFRKILPDSVSFFSTKKPSLKNKIQLSVIGMIIISFFVMGIVTVWFFKNSSNEYHAKRLERKTKSVRVDALHELSLLIEDSQNNFQPSRANLSKLDLVDPLSHIHRLDVNMYDLSGKLIASSEEDIFNKGIISTQMAAPAYKALKNQGINWYTQEREFMGELQYKAAYIPLTFKNKTIAFLGLPYYSENTSLRSDVTVFMSTLLNVYVFLLLIASAIAIFVSNSITKPITVIGEKLKRLKLGIRNQPLEYKSKDEIGTLIEEYNSMIQKLQDSANRLAQSEREGAWREMAKQVAHEIKNPLTPMKLSIQYLQHAFRSNPDNIEPLLKRVSNTLIEQIDNLAHIASEFSNFAKMPRAENQNINFNQLVVSVYDLFNDGEGDMDISLNLPKETYVVYADKNHLMRVLNNLVKNAQQAIPDDRLGKINISLYREDEVVILKVSDNGIGISDDKKDKVFVPNFTTKSSGTGLGLAISKNIIESVNGVIHFKTIIGEGTDFFVELPIIEVSEPEVLPEFTIE